MIDFAEIYFETILICKTNKYFLNVTYIIQPVFQRNMFDLHMSMRQVYSKSLWGITNVAAHFGSKIPVIQLQDNVSEGELEMSRFFK